MIKKNIILIFLLGVLLGFQVAFADQASCRLLSDDMKILEVSVSAIEKSKTCSQYQYLKFSFSRVEYHYDLIATQNYWREIEQCAPLFTQLSKALTDCNAELAIDQIALILEKSKIDFESYCTR